MPKHQWRVVGLVTDTGILYGMKCLMKPVTAIVLHFIKFLNCNKELIRYKHHGSRAEHDPADFRGACRSMDEAMQLIGDHQYGNGTCQGHKP